MTGVQTCALPIWGVAVRRYAKPTFTKPAPADLRYQIAQECTHVIEALAD